MIARQDRVEFEARLLGSIAQPVIAIDPEFRVIYWNGGATDIIGWTAEEMLGELVLDKLEIHLSDPRAERLLVQLAGAEVVVEEFVLQHKDGTKFPALVTLTPIVDDAAELIGIVAVATDITERIKAERVAKEEHRRLEEAQRLANLGNFEFELTGGRIEWSRGLKRILGFEPEDPSNREEFLRRIHPEDKQLVVRRFAEWAENPQHSFDLEFRYVLPDGSIRWLHSRGECESDAEQGELVMIGTTQDVTDWRETDFARRLAEEQFSVAFELGNVGMLVIDTNREILRVNPALCRMLGRSADELIGKTPDSFAVPSEVAEPGHSIAERLLRSGAGAIDAERRYLKPNGEVVWALVHLAVVRLNGEPQYMFAQVVDITDRKRVEDELQRLAMHDPLTGLPNRYLLQDRLETALARAHRSNQRVGIFFVDVDHFKLVNDTLGHAAGDSLLVQVAGRLARESREGDTVARFGGDEFVMVCENLRDIAEASAIGERIEALFEEAFLIGEQLLYATVSTGIVLADQTATPVTVLRDADAAMYRAKERGRARVEVFDETLHHRAAKRLDIEMMLRHALERDQLRVVFQPLMSLPGEVPIGVEALVRWEHPDRGLLLPGDFIPAAEETGLIGAIGGWVLNRAVAQLGTWQVTLPGASTMFMAVNLSPRQLIAGDLLARCRDVTAAYHVSTETLCLEITEGAVMDDVEISIPILRRISDTGIRLAVDDFGAGYSSLSYLKRLPVQMLKIDRSFIDGLGHDADDSAIVRAIVSLGYALNLELCAEGVETPTQRAELVGLGCQQAQGYLWAPPMPADDFESWYSRRLVLPVV
jgi:diguanylate cyclase (GGDEF)-like protein/PAS domain S-box-containing protein